MGLLCNPYDQYQRPWGATRFKTSSPLTCMLHFLPIRKDVALNTNYNLFLFYYCQLIDIVLNSSLTQLDCASTVCNPERSADLKTLEDIQLQLVALCQHSLLWPCYLTALCAVSEAVSWCTTLCCCLFGLKRCPSVWVLPVLQFQTLQFTAACCDCPSARC
jgi:hypothetical protein